MRLSSLGVCAVGIAGGVAAERWAFGVDRPLLWLPDLAVGVALISAGAGSMGRARGGAGWLLVATGFAWFAGTTAPVALYWHRGVLVHLLVSYPAGRPASRTGWLVVSVGYLAAVGPLWRDEWTSIVLAAAALWLSLAGLRRASSPRRRARQISCGVGAGLAAVVLAGAIARLALPAGAAALPSLLVYEAALVTAAIYLGVGLRPAGSTTVTDLVVELGENRSTALRDALAEVLGDPTVRLGYWQPAKACYVDSAGNSLPAATPGNGRTLRRIDRDGRPFAAVLHDSALAEDSTFADAVAAADRLTSAHAALQADIRTRAAQVAASRRRLQIAADAERCRLERRLAAAPESRLVDILRELRGMGRRNPHLDRAVLQLEKTLVELHEAAQGLYPRDLAGGLYPGLVALADRCPVPVELSVTRRRFDSQVEVAAYYLCAEALTNVAKHARASAVSVDIAIRSGVLAISVTDDGAGGAAPTGGTGVLGLIDRLESIGGRLDVDSRPGAGTKLTAEIPLDGQSR